MRDAPQPALHGGCIHHLRFDTPLHVFPSSTF
jgi:hypothetical protein